jgi:hypothetical protein
VRHDEAHLKPVGRATFLVEHYWPGVEAGSSRATAERVRASAAELAASGAAIGFVHATLVPDEEVVFCVIRADSRSTVEETYRRAGVTFDRIVDAVELVAGTDTDP